MDASKINRKIHIILGTKAQLIKMAPVMAELEKRGIPYNFIFTGQHKETIDKLLENFGVKRPDITLYDGKDITSIFQMFAWIIKILYWTIKNKNKILGMRKNKDDIILTHGDTFSTLLGALMGKSAGIKVGHVESGLRSFNIFHPFPEELTRLAVFCLSDRYFCPGEWAMKNLKRFKGEKINTQANTLLDSLRLALQNNENRGSDIPTEKYCVCSVHRFENIFNKRRLQEIIQIIKKAAQCIRVLFILHPPTIKQLEKYGLKTDLEKSAGIELRPRYDYFDFIKLLNKSEFLITDGGSNQEEGFYLGKPCLLLRNATERNEGLGQNAVISKYNAAAITDFVENYGQYKIAPPELDASPSEIIVSYLLKNT